MRPSRQQVLMTEWTWTPALAGSGDKEPGDVALDRFHLSCAVFVDLGRRFGTIRQKSEMYQQFVLAGAKIQHAAAAKGQKIAKGFAGSPSETEGVSRRRGIGKVIDSNGLLKLARGCRLRSVRASLATRRARSVLSLVLTGRGNFGRPVPSPSIGPSGQ